MKKKTFIIIGILGIAALVAGYLLSQKGLEAEISIISAHDVTDTFTEDGIVKQGESISLLSKVDGQVTAINFAPNAYVNKGDVIATIDSKDYAYGIEEHQQAIKAYEAQIANTTTNEMHDKEKTAYSIKQLNEQIASLEANKKVSDIEQITSSSPEEYINILKLNLEVCKSQYERTQKEYDKLKQLFEASAASQNELEIAQTNCTTAKAAQIKAQTQYDNTNDQLHNLSQMGIKKEEINQKFYELQDENLDANIASIKTQVASLENQLSQDYSSHTIARLNALIASENVAIKSLNDQIADCKITATTSGYITELPIQNLSVVQVGTTLATIKPTDELKISVDVLTSSEPYLKVGDPVLLKQKLKSEDITFTGTIKEIYDFAKESTSALGLNEYRVEVIITPDDTSISLKDGYEIEVSFTTYKKTDCLSVPNSAVFKIDDNDYVYKLSDGKATLAPIKIDHETNTESVISEGLSEGEQVIYNANLEGLTDGTQIKALTK